MYQSVGYGYGSRTELTKVSGTSLDVPSLPRCRVWYGCLYPVPVPDPLYFNKAVPGTRVFCRGRTELTKVSGTGNTRGTYVHSLPYNTGRPNGSVGNLESF